MKAAKKVRVLSALDLFLRILKAYNADNFRQIDRPQLVRNICFTIGVFIGLILIVNMITLGTWHLVGSGGDLNKLVVSGPVVLSIVQLLISYFALTAKNRQIAATIEQIQRVVEQRKLGEMQSW